MVSGMFCCMMFASPKGSSSNTHRCGQLRNLAHDTRQPSCIRRIQESKRFAKKKVTHDIESEPVGLRLERATRSPAFKLSRVARALAEQFDEFLNTSDDPRFHAFQRLLCQGLRYHSPLEAMESLVGCADQIGRAAGTHRGVALAFADVGPDTVDLRCCFEAEERERVGAVADDFAWRRISPSCISIWYLQTEWRDVVCLPYSFRHFVWASRSSPFQVKYAGYQSVMAPSIGPGYFARGWKKIRYMQTPAIW
jgi:hypothetical protein